MNDLKTSIFSIPHQLTVSALGTVTSLPPLSLCMAVDSSIEVLRRFCSPIAMMITDLFFCQFVRIWPLPEDKKQEEKKQTGSVQ